MNKRDLTRAVAVHADTSLTTVSAVLEGFTDVVTAVVAQGETVAIGGFAKFARVNRAARMGRNPATGERIRIKASKKARITPMKAFTDAVISRGSAPKLTRGAYPTSDEAVQRAGAARSAPARKATAPAAPARRRTTPRVAAPRRRTASGTAVPARRTVAAKTTARERRTATARTASPVKQTGRAVTVTTRTPRPAQRTTASARTSTATKPAAPTPRRGAGTGRPRTRR